MPKPRSSTLESATARRKLAARKKPFWCKIAPGVHVGYRRCEGPGTWSVRRNEGTVSWIKRIALADDFEPAAPPTVLSFWQAQEEARKLARQAPGAPVDESRPLSVGEALDAYKLDLLARGASPYNAMTVRGHLPAVLLAKPVALLGAGELKRWRDGLIGKMAPASINRLLKSLRAAFALAAECDGRIANKDARKVGLQGLPDATRARNVILPDSDVRRLVAAAYDHDDALGLLCEVLAQSGARPSQAARLVVGDLEVDPKKPRLMMPRSAKGGSRNRVERKALRFPVPIPLGLAQRLQQAAKDRPDDAPLLLQGDGKSWEAGSDAYRDDLRIVVASAGFDCDTVTAYCFRHSSIVRQLLLNVPIRVIASTHDTSVAMIEAHYSKHIAEYSDDLSRRALLPDAPLGDNVVAIAGR